VKVFPDFGWDVMVATARREERGSGRRAGGVGRWVVVLGKSACRCRLASGLGRGKGGLGGRRGRNRAGEGGTSLSGGVGRESG
jgi:hypothetical protein